ncbi:unnamed protein product [Psylliodes chrysocephalus]|uniref:Uncharacterized protein n=1 Tax=Psylliodes chrysocephalus TaxID=3402493 RepID=A0A9P0CKU9_9CUCU|nr:unnamed protein product [Psylliodes chrysocephala]
MNLMPPKQLGSRCNGASCSKRNKKCSLFRDGKRQEIMQDFYSMKSLQLQRECIARYIKMEEIKQKTTQKEVFRRNKSNYYFLPLDGDELPVFKTFFNNTLPTTAKTISTTLSKKSTTGIIEKEQIGGRYKLQVDRELHLINVISEHINKFGRVESHYCRQNLTREYLHENFSLLKMFSMYLSNESGPLMKGAYSVNRKYSNL